MLAKHPICNWKSSSGSSAGKANSLQKDSMVIRVGSDIADTVQSGFKPLCVSVTLSNTRSQSLFQHRHGHFFFLNHASALDRFHLLFSLWHILSANLMNFFPQPSTLSSRIPPTKKSTSPIAFSPLSDHYHLILTYFLIQRCKLELIWVKIYCFWKCWYSSWSDGFKSHGHPALCV